MISPTLLAIERSIRALFPEEKLWLLERIAHNLREHIHATAHISDSEDRSKHLVAMTSDPDTQAELTAINKES